MSEIKFKCIILNVVNWTLILCELSLKMGALNLNLVNYICICELIFENFWTKLELGEIYSESWWAKFVLVELNFKMGQPILN